MRPEILAPAGNEEALKAAVAAGCDAVYFALPQFGARAYAENFTLEKTKEMIDYCHLYGVKVYITMNTVIYEDEMEAAYTQAKALHEMNVDALIIQDLGFIHYLHHRLPNLELHVSTQVSVNKPEMIESLKKLGVKRVVLARECTDEEIEACAQTGMEIEVFVHGAICICYSGQCYFSSLRYNRSGNRGKCAQPCRMPYTLLEDGKEIDTEGPYLLSPKDLSLIKKVNRLSKIGVCSLKIEGRMKSKEYVYESVALVKKALSKERITPEEFEKLDVTFNRGYTKGHTYHKNGKDLMNFVSNNHQGIDIGKVVKIKNGKMIIELTKDLNQNDGVRFVNGDIQEGCRVNYLYDQRGKLVNSQKAGSICMMDALPGIKAGSIVKKTINTQLNHEIEDKIQHMERQVPVQAHFTCEEVGDYLVCEASDGENYVCVYSDTFATKAQKHSTDEDVLTKQFSKTKNSWAKFTYLTFELGKNIYFSISDMNKLRRDTLEALEKKRCECPKIIEKDYSYKVKKPPVPKNLIEIQTKEQMIKTDDLLISELAPVTRKGNVTQVEGDVLSHLGNGKIVDTNLNITNSYAIAAMMEMGYKQVGISDECSLEQVEMMVNSFKERYGIVPPVCKTVYQKRRLMTINYCPVNTTLKDGTRTRCNLCHTHKYELLSKDGTKSYCLGDSNCHMRLFDTIAQNDLEDIPKYKDMGIQAFKVIFVDETRDEILDIIKTFNELKA